VVAQILFWVWLFLGYMLVSLGSAILAGATPRRGWMERFAGPSVLIGLICFGLEGVTTVIGGINSDILAVVGWTSLLIILAAVSGVVNGQISIK